jgi:hypothetical protein
MKNIRNVLVLGTLASTGLVNALNYNLSAQAFQGLQDVEVERYVTSKALSVPQVFPLGGWGEITGGPLKEYVGPYILASLIGPKTIVTAVQLPAADGLQGLQKLLQSTNVTVTLPGGKKVGVIKWDTLGRNGLLHQDAKFSLVILKGELAEEVFGITPFRIAQSGTESTGAYAVIGLNTSASPVFGTTSLVPCEEADGSFYSRQITGAGRKIGPLFAKTGNVVTSFQSGLNRYEQGAAVFSLEGSPQLATLFALGLFGGKTSYYVKVGASIDVVNWLSNPVVDGGFVKKS